MKNIKRQAFHNNRTFIKPVNSKIQEGTAERESQQYFQNEETISFDGIIYIEWLWYRGRRVNVPKASVICIQEHTLFSLHNFHSI